MEFRILGPLEVCSEAKKISITGVRQQTVLSALLLYANHTVTVDRLIEAVYGEDRPATARVQVQISTSSLRRIFAEHGLRDIIVTQPHGYTIRVNPEELDFLRFEGLVGDARRAREDGRLQEAAAIYQQALALWRGDVLTGIDSRFVRVAAGRLAECRIMAAEDCIQLELELGRHHELIGWLTELLDHHPLRERLRGQLMTALYRSGRHAEALQVYQEGRRVLVEELGIEPPRRLQQLEFAILTGDRSLDPPASEAHPAALTTAANMLPTDTGDFTGRDAAIAEAGACLTPAESRARLAVPVLVVTGKPGVGKTALALHVAHRAAAQFDGGRLFADLHGATGEIRPADVLERFLRVLGVPGAEIPQPLEERAELFRARLAGRRTLIVLDDVAREGDVLPLLPGDAGCCVLITSRTRLAALPGADRLLLNVLDDTAAVELLARVVGDDRVRDESEAAVRLAELCGGLPLALRIAGTRLSARPHWSLGQLVDRLEDDAHRLDELNHGGLSIRDSLRSAYEGVDPVARRLFRRLAVLESPTLNAWAALALLDAPADEAQEALDALTESHLLEAAGNQRGALGQYRMPGLVRVFALERLAAEEPEQEQGAALDRVLAALVTLAEAAAARTYGILAPEAVDAIPGGLVKQVVACPRSWLDQELPVLLACVGQAARAGSTELSWRLAVSAATCFRTRPETAACREALGVALSAAEKFGDRRGEAMLRFSSGSLHLIAERLDPACRELNLALELFTALADERGRAWVLGELGRLDQLRGRLESLGDRLPERPRGSAPDR